MRTLFLTAIALMSMAVASAQTSQADVEASQKRVAELKKLVDEQPKKCDVAEIDGYAAAVSEAAVLAISNSEKISELYAKQAAGEKPVLVDLVSLGASVAAEAKQLKAAQEKAEAAVSKLKQLSEDAKKGNPMAKAKAAKQMNAATKVMTYAQDAAVILATETVEQGKIVEKMISAAKK